jgi:Mg2+-importing ATPase
LNVLAIVGIGLALPFSPFADVLGFVQLPPSYLLFLAVAVTSYLALVELAKRGLYAWWNHRQRETVRPGRA